MSTPTGEPTSAEEPDRVPSAPALEYSSPALSSYDRPVEAVVRTARNISIAVRITFWVFGLAAIAFAAWAVWQLKNTFDAIGQSPRRGGGRYCAITRELNEMTIRSVVPR